MKFLDADAKRLLASTGALVDEGNRVVFCPWESYIRNTGTSHTIPMHVRQGVFVVQLDVHANSSTVKAAKHDESSQRHVQVIRRCSREVRDKRTRNHVEIGWRRN